MWETGKICQWMCNKHGPTLSHATILCVICCCLLSHSKGGCLKNTMTLVYAVIKMVFKLFCKAHKKFSKSYNQTVFLWVPQQQAPGCLPTPKRWMHTPMAQSGSVLCPLVMDYCKQEGKRSRREGIAVYVTLIDEANAVGVQRDNNSICVAEGGIKILRALYINTHVCVFLASWCRKKNRRAMMCFLATSWHQSQAAFHQRHWQSHFTTANICCFIHYNQRDWKFCYALLLFQPSRRQWEKWKHIHLLLTWHPSKDQI